MTREEAIEVIKQDIPCEHDTDLIEAFDMAIKALEQEPFINKPCVSHQVCHEDKVKVLDKIRAEIERQEKWLLQAGCTTYNVDIAFDSIKSVLAESEDKE